MQNQRRTISSIMIVVLVALELILFVLEKGLNQFGLMYRSWISWIQLMAGVVLFFLIIYKLFRCFVRFGIKKSRYTAFRGIASILGCLSLFVMIVLVVVYVPVAVAFGYEPEHVTVKNGEKSVAYVNSFLEIWITYHPYVNGFVCGLEPFAEEHYGSGGYDPFKDGYEPDASDQESKNACESEKSQCIFCKNMV